MTLSDTINHMIEVKIKGANITSAGSERVINKVISITDQENPDLEGEIKNLVEIDQKDNITSEPSSKKKQGGGFESEQTKMIKELEKQQKELQKQKRESERDLIEIKQLKKELDEFDSEFGKKIDDLTKAEVKAKGELRLANDELKKFDNTSLKDLQSLTSEQVTNLQQITKDPFQFLLSKFFKKFAKGAGIAALATLIFSAVQLIISELFKPGRLLDRRFRRTARDEILLFNNESEQAELRQGFRTVTVTTVKFLRGSQLIGQISGNLYNPTALSMNRLDQRRVIPPIPSTQNASRSSKFSNRRNSRFG